MMRNLTLGSLLLVLCPAGVVAGDGLVALQTAEASCRNGSSAAYVDCGNGTVTDTSSGLVWLKNADCLGGGVDWYTAMEVVAGLADLDDGFCANKGLTAAVCDCGLSDGSSPGEWRLPSRAEWQAMVADAVDLGCSPTITSDFPAGIIPCWSAGCSTLGLCAFSDVQSASYWSSTTSVSSPNRAWGVFLQHGEVYVPDSKGGGNENSVWPVRGGQ